MYERRWYEIPVEIGLILFCGVLTYLLTRSLYGLSELAAFIAGGAGMLVGGLSTYCGHRLRKMHIESLPPEERAAVAWRLLRRALIASLLGLLAAGFGFLAIYWMWQGDVVLALLPLGVGLALSLWSLLIIRPGWPRSSANGARGTPEA